VLECRQCVRVNTPCGRETTRAIRAVQMSAGDKDRSGFHRLGGSLTQARSRDSTREHEHCTLHMLADPPESSAYGIVSLGRARRLPHLDQEMSRIKRPDASSGLARRLEIFVSPN
jgi:hypothetical protein